MEELEPEPIISPFLVLSSFCRNAPASPRSLQVSLRTIQISRSYTALPSGLQPPPRAWPKAQLSPATGRSKLSPGALKRRFSTTARRSSRMALDNACGGTYPIRQGKPSRVTMNGEACTPMRHLGHCSAHLIISLSLRLLAAICLAAGKCCPGYRHRKSSKTIEHFQHIRRQPEVFTGSSPGTPRFDIRFVTFTGYHFGTVSL